MTNEKQLTHVSKFLSLVLRHQPEIIGIQLDANGWVDVQELIEKSNKKGNYLDLETLKIIVETNSKKRFAFNDSLDKIRASQGHSIEIELGYTSQQPPDFLFHGTSEKSVQAILKTGLEKRSRQHVHLSSEMDTAFKVGHRHGVPYIFKVLAGEMYLDKFDFYLSENGVWLTDNVPAKYLKPNTEK